MKILITGSNGLLGQKLLHKLRLDKNIDLELVKGILKIKFLDQFNSNHLTNK